MLQEQKDRARAAAKKVEIGLDAGAVPPTTFVGYEQPEAEAPIALLLSDENGQLEVAEEGQAVRVFLDRTPFYAEGGGQVGDHGVIRTHTGTVRVHRHPEGGGSRDRARGRRRVGRGPAPDRTRSRRSIACSGRARRGRTPRPT